MNIEVNVSGNGLVGEMVGIMAPESRRRLYADAANDLSELIRGHIRRYAFQRHTTAHRLGAQPTGHYTDGADEIHSTATSERGTVVVPIPGIKRAFGDVRIEARNAKALTIPVDALAYGKRASELRSVGWTLFRITSKKGSDLLMGTDGEVTKPLYLLRKSVTQRRDPSLMPTMEEMERTVVTAMKVQIRKRLESARRKKAQ